LDCNLGAKPIIYDVLFFAETIVARKSKGFNFFGLNPSPPKAAKKSLSHPAPSKPKLSHKAESKKKSASVSSQPTTPKAEKKKPVVKAENETRKNPSAPRDESPAERVCTMLLFCSFR
jgi:hypothetical protein